MIEEGYWSALSLLVEKKDVNVNDIHLAIQIFTTRIARKVCGVPRTAELLYELFRLLCSSRKDSLRDT